MERRTQKGRMMAQSPSHIRFDTARRIREFAFDEVRVAIMQIEHIDPLKVPTGDKARAQGIAHGFNLAIQLVLEKLGRLVP